MPELPDLELYSKNLNQRLRGQTVTQVVVYKDKRLNVTPVALTEALSQATLAQVKRNGKALHFGFSNQQVLETHLMLKGGFDIVSDDTDLKYKLLSLRFDKESLVLSDSQSLATMTLNPEVSTVPDALDPRFDLEYLKNQLRKKKSVPLKGFLIDPKIVRGIGNAYADEILWESRIAPESSCGKLPEEIVETLFQAIQGVLMEGIRQLEVRHPDAIKGEFREFLKIHNPNQTLSPTGKPILRKTIASKTTYFSEDQVVY